MLSKSNFLLITLLIALSSGFAFGQTGVKYYKIAGISVEGNKFADEQTIIALSGLRPGQEIQYPGDNKIPAALKSLWERKQFSNIDIQIDKITSMGLFLIIKVEEFPRIAEIYLNNNEEINDEDILKAINRTRGDILSGFDIYQDRKIVKDLYKEEGLAFTKVDNIMTDINENYVNYIFDITEGIEYYVSDIEFVGNEEFEDDDLASEFDDTHTTSWWEFWRSSKFEEKEYEADKALLLNFYMSKGFVDAEIVTDTLMYDEENEEVKIRLDVVEGKKQFVRDIIFEGNTVYPDEVLLKRLDFRKGEPYDKTRFSENLNHNESQTDVTSLYMDHGYLMARIMPEEKRVSEDSVDILVNIYENKRVKIRRVDIVGNSKTHDKVIRRELYTRPGDYFDRSAIIRSIRGLGVLNYFNPEKLNQPPAIKPAGDTEVDLVYTVEEKSTEQINMQIGFAGTFGFTGAVGLTLNNFNIQDPLGGGAGQVFNLQAEFGQANRYQNYSLGFSEPWLFDEPTTVGFNIYYSWIKYSSEFQIRRKGVALNFGRRFRWPDDYFRGSWNIRLQENYVPEEASSSYYRPGETTEFTIGQTISRISMNNLFFPTIGSNFKLATQWAMGVAGLGNTDFLKNQLTFETAYPMLKFDGQDKLVLYLSSNLGYITGIETDTLMSPIEMYYMGGNGLGYFSVTPLRGYDDNSIKYQSSKVGNGKVMARHIAELRFAISMDAMPIYVYTFLEAGNIWGGLDRTDPFNLKRAAGIGVQMNMNPFGMIGFSYGYGFDSPGPTGSPAGWKFLFHIGAMR